MPIKKTKTNSTEFDDLKARIVPIAERPLYLAALFYGRSGTGKTALASTFPKPALVLDIREKGTDTIAKVPGIDVLEVSEWEDIEKSYWYLKSKTHKYKTVILDQISQMQDVALLHVLEENGKKEGDLLSKKDWGQISGMMKTWLFNYRDLIDTALHVVFIAQDRATTNDDNIEDQIDPSIGARLMPSLAAAVNGAVSVIGNTFIREEYLGKDKERHVKYCLRIGPHAYYATKIRRPVDFVAPEFIVNPTFDKIIKIIRGEKAEPKKLGRK
jgi:AAA domain